MIGLFLSAYNEEENGVTLEFVRIASVASTKSEVLKWTKFKKYC